MYPCQKPASDKKMPFWKKECQATESNGKNSKPKEKVNYKARLEHKQMMVSGRNFKIKYLKIKKSTKTNKTTKALAQFT